MKKILFAIVAVMLTALCVSSCTALSGGSFEPSAQDKRVVMNIGTKEVQYQEYRYYALNNKRDSFPDTDVLSEKQLSELVSLIEQNAKYTAAIELMANKYGAVLSEEDISAVEATIADFRATQCQNNDEIYLMALEEQFMTDYLFRKLQQNNALAYNTIEKMRESGAVKTDDAAAEALFVSDELICIKEIYIGYADDSLKEYARERAEEAHDTLVLGRSFAEVMREYSAYNEDVMPPEDGYYTTEYEMPEYIWKAATSLAEGEYSVIIESESGFHIVMRCEKNTEYMQKNKEDILARYASAAYTKELYELIDSLSAKYTKYGSSIDLNAIS